jgi:hypothetical protein
MKRHDFVKMGKEIPFYFKHLLATLSKIWSNATINKAGWMILSFVKIGSGKRVILGGGGWWA